METAQNTRAGQRPTSDGSEDSRGDFLEDGCVEMEAGVEVEGLLVRVKHSCALLPLGHIVRRQKHRGRAHRLQLQVQMLKPFTPSTLCAQALVGLTLCCTHLCPCSFAGASMGRVLCFAILSCTLLCKCFLCSVQSLPSFGSV